MLLFLNVTYVLVAIAMVALILMQRGAGAQAGSGFGGGASGTVFGARGASSFLTKATKWLAILFFAISLFMAWHASRGLGGVAEPAQNLGVMSQVPTTPVQSQGDNATVPSVPAQISPAPQAQQAPAVDGAVPAVPAPTSQVPPATSESTAPATPVSESTNPEAPPSGG